MEKIEAGDRKPSLTPVFTIGHSTRTIGEFVELLRAGEVRMVIDIRKIPRSRTNPQFNVETLGRELAPFQIGHTRIEELGGLRKRRYDVPPETNGYWTNRSFHNYADYALSDDFGRGLRELLSASSEKRVAVMCSEAVWWRCHRRIVADYVLDAGRSVYHLMGSRNVVAANLTAAAVRCGDGLHYPTNL